MNAITNLLTTKTYKTKIKNFPEFLKWTQTRPTQIVKGKQTIKHQKKKRQEEEKIWGNNMIGQNNNGQWTTLLGEWGVYDILQYLGKHPKKVLRKNGFEPDWEADDGIYEVKTRNWCVSGTAGEKVYGTFIKYRDIPELYGKPLYIICVGYQEWELTHGKTRYFGDKVDEKTKQALELAKSWNIHYVPFSKLVSELHEHLKQEEQSNPQEIS